MRSSCAPLRGELLKCIRGRSSSIAAATLIARGVCPSSIRHYHRPFFIPLTRIVLRVRYYYRVLFENTRQRFRRVCSAEFSVPLTLENLNSKSKMCRKNSCTTTTTDHAGGAIDRFNDNFIIFIKKIIGPIEHVRVYKFTLCAELKAYRVM